jgi:hypothetical protein
MDGVFAGTPGRADASSVVWMSVRKKAGKIKETKEIQGSGIIRRKISDSCWSKGSRVWGIDLPSGEV